MSSTEAAASHTPAALRLLQRYKASCRDINQQKVDCQQHTSKSGPGCMQCVALQHSCCVTACLHAALTQAVLLLGGVDPGQVVIHRVYRAGHHLPATSRGYLEGVMSKTDAKGMPQAASNHHWAADEGS